MTQDEIIETALNSGLPSKESVHNTLWWLETFAKLVASAAIAKEREACANLCKDFDSQVSDCCAAAIRARGEK